MSFASLSRENYLSMIYEAETVESGEPDKARRKSDERVGAGDGRGWSREGKRESRSIEEGKVEEEIGAEKRRMMLETGYGSDRLCTFVRLVEMCVWTMGQNGRRCC